MIKHMIKLVWNRKRVNILIMIEIFVSFIVLFAAILGGVFYIDNYLKPIGFEYENVWRIGISDNQNREESVASETSRSNGPAQPRSPEAVNSKAETVRQLALAVREFPEVEEVSFAMIAPYSNSAMESAMDGGGVPIRFGVDIVSDDFQKALGLQVVLGRWFSREDDGQQYQPVVINQLMARELFGDSDPIGKEPQRPKKGPDKEQSNEPPRRIVGVISDFRKDGEYAASENFMFRRLTIDDKMERTPNNMLIKVRPGATAALEERLIKRLQNSAGNFSFEIEPLSKMREEMNMIRLAPVIAAGLIAAFLMIMVAMGLTGVLWQNVTQRTREIGLRRAKGATKNKIYQQILGELVIISTFGLAIGIIIVSQFQILKVIDFISLRVYVMSMIISVILIYALTVLCGLYPSRMATKIHPAEALHYE